MVQLIMDTQLFLTFQAAGEILSYGESYRAVLSCGKSLLLCCRRWFIIPSLWMKFYGVTIQVKAKEQYFPMVLFIRCF